MGLEFTKHYTTNQYETAGLHTFNTFNFCNLKYFLITLNLFSYSNFRGNLHFSALWILNRIACGNSDHANAVFGKNSDYYTSTVKKYLLFIF